MRTILQLNGLSHSKIIVLTIILLATSCSQRNPISSAVEKEANSGGPKGRPIRLANIGHFRGARQICLIPESLTLGDVFQNKGVKEIDNKKYRYRTPVESTNIAAVSDGLVRFVSIPWSDFGLISNESLGECVPAAIAALIPVKDTLSNNYYYKFGRLAEEQ